MQFFWNFSYFYFYFPCWYTNGSAVIYILIAKYKRKEKEMLLYRMITCLENTCLKLYDERLRSMKYKIEISGWLQFAKR